jgi:hypothetical protein
LGRPDAATGEHVVQLCTLAALAAPYASVRFVPTGGVTETNVWIPVTTESAPRAPARWSNSGDTSMATMREVERLASGGNARVQR